LSDFNNFCHKNSSHNLTSQDSLVTCSCCEAL